MINVMVSFGGMDNGRIPARKEPSSREEGKALVMVKIWKKGIEASRSGTSTRDPPFPTPSQPTTSDHTGGTIEKEGPEGEEPNIMQNKETPCHPLSTNVKAIRSFLGHEFDIEIRDKKGVENLAADHLSQLENPSLGKLTKAEIRDVFPEEQLMTISDKGNEPLFPGELKGRWYVPFEVGKDMENRAIELYDNDGNEFIVNKQHVKPYQKDALIIDKDDDIILVDEGGVT
ncbi:hypothetical protein Tco_0804181 [Tanacetum coccineum]|uniref:Reverse transcriptase domain-containing protein n=1 Tax=Tanacetum coccineum TaxID=301880 RepID=A0ABQ5A5A4_9ASTR